MSTDFGKWRSPVAHSAGGRAVAGSNPVFPTTSSGRGTGAGVSYWSDLGQIRESRKITVEQIHSDTKIPVPVIRDFERDGLESHDQLNAIYRRMLVVAYARSVGVDTDMARKAMSSTLSGAYDGALARSYLDWTPAEGNVPQGDGAVEAALPDRTPTVRGARARPKNRNWSIDGTILTALFMVAIVAATLLWVVFFESTV